MVIKNYFKKVSAPVFFFNINMLGKNTPHWLVNTKTYQVCYGGRWICWNKIFISIFHDTTRESYFFIYFDQNKPSKSAKSF